MWFSGKRKALGKGLSGSLSLPAEQKANKDYLDLDIKLIIPNRYQPRQVFDPEALESLALSLKQHGLIQPIIVRRGIEDKYELVSGERRWRAAALAGLEKIPAILKEVGDQGLMEWAIIENLQREDLNPIEKAKAYENLISEFSLTQENIAQRIGIDRSSVSNFLRLLQLPTELWASVSKGQITMGHAKALLSLNKKEEQITLAEEIISRHLSVRQTETAVQHINKRVLPNKKVSPLNTLLSKPTVVEDQLRQTLGTKVKLVQKGKSWELKITIHSQDDIDSILKRLT